MRSSSAMRRARSRDNAAHSSRVMPLTGINGSTSVAPIRGCAPWCCRMSINSPAFLTALKAASTTASGSPTKVITVRLVASPGSTLSNVTPGVPDISAAICLMISALRPSLKLGTHSTIRLSIYRLLRLDFMSNGWISSDHFQARHNEQALLHSLNQMVVEAAVCCSFCTNPLPVVSFGCKFSVNQAKCKIIRGVFLSKHGCFFSHACTLCECYFLFFVFFLL